LLIQGIGLLFGNFDPIYNWLLWYSSILLLTGALLIFIARLKSR